MLLLLISKMCFVMFLYWVIWWETHSDCIRCSKISEIEYSSGVEYLVLTVIWSKYFGKYWRRPIEPAPLFSVCRASANIEIGNAVPKTISNCFQVSWLVVPSKNFNVRVCPWHVGFGAQRRAVANGILSDLLSSPRYKALASEFTAPGSWAKNV